MQSVCFSPGKTIQKWSRNSRHDKFGKVRMHYFYVPTSCLWWLIGGLISLHFLYYIECILIEVCHISAYQNNDITEFEKILKTNHSNIMDDPFIREHIEGKYSSSGFTTELHDLSLKIVISVAPKCHLIFYSNIILNLVREIVQRILVRVIIKKIWVHIYFRILQL